MENVTVNDLKRHQKEALLRGESASVRGRIYTIADFPELRIPVALAPSPDAHVIEELRSRVVAANARIAELEAARGENGLAKLNLDSALKQRQTAETERDTARTEAAALKAQVSTLTRERDDARSDAATQKSRAENLEKAAADPDLAAKHQQATALIKELTNVDAQALTRLTTDQLAAIVRYRGLDPGDKPKAALVAMLAPAGG